MWFVHGNKVTNSTLWLLRCDSVRSIIATLDFNGKQHGRVNPATQPHGLESACVPSQQNEEMLPGPAVTEPLSDYHSEQPHAAVLTQSIIYTQTQAWSHTHTQTPAQSQTPAPACTHTYTGRMHVCQHIQYMSVHMVGIHTRTHTYTQTHHIKVRRKKSQQHIKLAAWVHT